MRRSQPSPKVVHSARLVPLFYATGLGGVNSLARVAHEGPAGPTIVASRVSVSSIGPLAFLIICP